MFQYLIGLILKVYPRDIISVQSGIAALGQSNARLIITMARERALKHWPHKVLAKVETLFTIILTVLIHLFIL